MKKVLKISVLALMAGCFAGGAWAEEGSEEIDDLKSERGYFFGYSFGNMLKEGDNGDADLERLIEGLRDSLAENPPQLSPEEQNAVIQIIRNRQQQLAQRQQQEAERMSIRNLEYATAFLDTNGSAEGVQTTDTGLQYVVNEAGSGSSPRPEDTVVVHYTGRLLGPDGQVSEDDGLIFDSSVARGQPATFGLRQVIPGWTEGLQTMKVGGKTRFFIPPDLAYGPGGTRGIPPNSLLVFDVELIEIKAAE